MREGFNVRGTVRSQSKGEYLAKLFKDAKARFEYVIVGDIAQVCCVLCMMVTVRGRGLTLNVQKGAFDEAVKGVNAVAHMAR